MKYSYYSLSQNFNSILQFYRQGEIISCDSFAMSHNITQRNVRKDQFVHLFISKIISGREEANYKRTPQVGKAGNPNLQEVHSYIDV